MNLLNILSRNRISLSQKFVGPSNSLIKADAIYFPPWIDNRYDEDISGSFTLGECSINSFISSTQNIPTKTTLNHIPNWNNFVCGLFGKIKVFIEFSNKYRL